MRMDTKHPLTVYRNESKVSQGELAERLGVGKWTVTSIEHGRRVPSPKLAIKIEAATGIPRAALRPDIFGAPVAAE